MTEVAQSPRPLSWEERRLLDHLLSIEEPRFVTLRDQAEFAEVAAAEPGLITLTVPRTASAATPRPGPVVSRSVSKAGSVDVTLWISDDGYLDSIEIMGLEAEVDRVPPPEELAPPIAP